MAPEMLAMTQTGNLGPVATPYARERFGHFDFGGIKVRNADQTFDRDLTIDVGGRQIDLLNLGPAHTAADSVVHVPDAGVLFGGDLLFIGCTPIVWAGPDRQLDCGLRRDDRAGRTDGGARPRSDHRSGWNPRCPWLSRARRRTSRGRLPQGPVLGGGRRHHRPRRVRDLAGRRAGRRQRLSALPRTRPRHAAAGGDGAAGDAGRLVGQTLAEVFDVRADSSVRPRWWVPACRRGERTLDVRSATQPEQPARSRSWRPGPGARPPQLGQSGGGEQIGEPGRESLPTRGLAGARRRRCARPG